MAMLTKKHFELFADYIRESQEPQVSKVACARMILILGKRENPQFSPEKFVKRCGLPDPLCW
jgi:hypothetical protein